MRNFKKGEKMPATIDYDKYSNMNKKQLLNALINAENKKQKIKQDLNEKIKHTTELIKFLKTKLKKSLNEPKSYTLAQAPSIKKINAYFEKLPQAEQDKIRAEVRAEMGLDV